jgi:hypothetical protein
LVAGERFERLSSLILMPYREVWGESIRKSSLSIRLMTYGSKQVRGIILLLPAIKWG